MRKVALRNCGISIVDLGTNCCDYWLYVIPSFLCTSRRFFFVFFERANTFMKRPTVTYFIISRAPNLLRSPMLMLSTKLEQGKLQKMTYVDVTLCYGSLSTDFMISKVW